LGGDKVDREKVNYWLETQPKFNDSLYTAAILGKNIELTQNFKIKVAKAKLKANSDMAELYSAKIKDMESLAEQAGKEDLKMAEEKKLLDMLDTAETALGSTKFVAGEAFSNADAILMTLLARVEMLKKQKDFIEPREKLSAYWNECKTRDSYKKVVGAYDGVKGLPVIFSTLAQVGIRSLFRSY
jgi:glutathione S-transferase